MQKLVLAGLIAIGLMLGTAAVSRADTGWSLEVGYAKLDNQDKIDYRRTEDGDCQEYNGDLYSTNHFNFIGLNYAINHRWSVGLKYNWGRTVIASALYNSIDDAAYSGEAEVEVSFLNLETKYQWSIGSHFSLGWLIGFSDLRIEAAGRIEGRKDGDDNSIDKFEKLEKSFYGPYLGVQTSYVPAIDLEKLKLRECGLIIYTVDMSDRSNLKNWNGDLYSVIALTQKWSLKVNYNIYYIAYNREKTNDEAGTSRTVHIANITGGPGVTLQYKF
jgi:hypothetical protein